MYYCTVLGALLFSLLVFCPVSYAQPTLSPMGTPRSATFYPGGARLEIDQSVTFQEGVAKVPLPAMVDPSDVILKVDGETVRTMHIEAVSAQNFPPSIQLWRDYDAARVDLLALEGRIARAEALQALWSKPDVSSFTTPELFVQMEGLMNERLSPLYVELREMERRREDAVREVERLGRALERTGATDIVHILTANLDTAISGERQATLHYKITNSGWSPKYRLEALLETGTGEKDAVHFVQEAELLQASGQDWENVQVYLASADPRGPVSPGILPPWRVAPRVTPEPRLAAAPMQAESAVMYRKDMMSIPEPTVSDTAYATYTIWDIGTRTLPAGIASRIALAEEKWPVRFTRLIRPALDQRAWLTAEIRLETQRQYPAGEAELYVQGEKTGTMLFMMADNEYDLSFGVDPRVHATMTLDKRQSGKTGLVGKRQTRTWNWTIEVKNGHRDTVDVRIEDAQPQSGDQAITIDAQSTPVPTVEEQTIVWTLEVPGNGERTISHAVTVTAPEDMRLMEGR